MKRTIVMIIAVLAVILLIAFGTRRVLPYAEYTTDPGALASDSAGVRPDTATPVDVTGDAAATTPVTDAKPAPAAVRPTPAEDRAAPPSQPPAAAPAGAAAPTGREPDVATILTRAAEAYAQVRTLQADFAMAMTNPLLRRTTNSRGALYQQRPDRIALRFSEPDGDVIVGDGQYFWIYYPSVDAQQVIRMPAAQGAAGGVDLQAQFLGNPVERFDATLHGTETVAGRDAYALTLVPRGPAGYERLRVWLDARDYLARRFEITEETGTVRRFDLAGLRTNATIAPDVFRFSPPAGARIVERG